uniref:Uncharacterized protein n=1 Tax=Opuntia streptacantha TaxID=393608 RepID=A0A7C8ZG54_OPUST
MMFSQATKITLLNSPPVRENRDLSSSFRSLREESSSRQAAPTRNPSWSELSVLPSASFGLRPSHPVVLCSGYLLLQSSPAICKCRPSSPAIPWFSVAVSLSQVWPNFFFSLFLRRLPLFFFSSSRLRPGWAVVLLQCYSSTRAPLLCLLCLSFFFF